MSSVPIACSLAGNEARLRWGEWNALMSVRLGAERSAQSLTVRFAAAGADWERLVALVDSERVCCGFVEWELEDLGDQISLSVRGDEDGVTAMAESFGISA